jgi:hypothetical protein
MANLETISPLSIKVGDTIKFTVIDINDTTLYSGKVVSVCDYDSARAYADVNAIHQAMLAADPMIDDVTLLRFIVVECYDGVRRPYGFQTDGKKSWFSNNSVEVIETGSEYQIKLYNVSNEEATLAIRILREQGYVCKIVK